MEKTIYTFGKSYILTNDGYFDITILVNKKIKIWDGLDWKETIIKSLNSNNISETKKKKIIIDKFNRKKIIYSTEDETYDIYKITTKDGGEMSYLKNQNLLVMESNNIRNNDNKLYNKIQVDKLKIGNIIYDGKFPIIDGDKKYNVKYPYTHGYYCGYKNIQTDISDEKSFTKEENILINLVNDRKKLQIELDKVENFLFNESKSFSTGLLYDNFDRKIIVPINGTIENKLLWMGGLIDSNGFITKKQMARYLNLSINNSKPFAQDVKLLCNTLSLNPSLEEKKITRKSIKKNIDDTTDTADTADTDIEKIIWQLSFNSEDTNKLFIDLKLPYYHIDYDKNDCNIEQDITIYNPILSIMIDNKPKKIFSLSEIKFCVINGVLI